MRPSKRQAHRSSRQSLGAACGSAPESPGEDERQRIRLAKLQLAAEWARLEEAEAASTASVQIGIDAGSTSEGPSTARATAEAGDSHLAQCPPQETDAHAHRFSAVVFGQDDPSRQGAHLTHAVSMKLSRSLKDDDDDTMTSLIENSIGLSGMRQAFPAEQGPGASVGCKPSTHVHGATMSRKERLEKRKTVLREGDTLEDLTSPKEKPPKRVRGKHCPTRAIPQDSKRPVRTSQALVAVDNL